MTRAHELQGPFLPGRSAKVSQSVRLFELPGAKKPPTANPNYGGKVGSDLERKNLLPDHLLPLLPKMDELHESSKSSLTHRSVTARFKETGFRDGNKWAQLSAHF